MNLRALDLFCGAGGASMGIHRAGFEVVGVDIAPQKRYPFEFRQGDALDADLSGFDFVWASPPCQAFTLGNHSARSAGKVSHPNLIPACRLKLQKSGLPYIIENVNGAPLLSPVMLCGTMFGLGVMRHRCFESNFLLLAPPHTGHSGKIGDGEFFSVAGCSGRWKSWGTVKRDVSKGSRQDWRTAMAIDWMTCKELTQAIPPAYSEFLCRQIAKCCNLPHADL